MGSENNQRIKILLRILVGLILIFVAMAAILRSGVLQSSTTTIVSRVLLQMVG